MDVSTVRGEAQARYIDPAQRERSKTFDRKIDAERFLTGMESRKQRDEWIDPALAATPFGDWAGEWLATRSHLKAKTLQGYESLLRVWVLPFFGTMRLERIDAMSVDRWVAEMLASGLSPSRARQAYQVLNAILKAAVRNRYLSSNPAEGTRLPKPRHREMLFVTAQQLDDLAEAIAQPYGTLIFVLGYGGLRWGEAAALRRKRIDVLNSRIEVAESVAEVGGRLICGTTKNHRVRTVVVPSAVRQMLNDHLNTHVEQEADALLFTAQRGTPLRHSNFRRNTWRPAVAAASLPEQLRIHDLRHTAAALMIAGGAHPEHIKRHLGHSSIMVTMEQYGHLYPSEAEAVAARLDGTLRAARTDNRRTRQIGQVEPGAISRA